MKDLASLKASLTKERNQLALKLGLLQQFINGDEAVKLSPAYRNLLFDQYMAMNEYHRLLCKRLEIAFEDIEDNNED